jgi:hypothetical protein
MKMITSPADLDLFNLSTVFEVCDVGQGNLAISKLVALKNFGPFLRSTYYWMSHSTFLGGGDRHVFESINTSTGFRQNIGTPTGRLGKNFGLFPYYDVYLQVLKLDGLTVVFPTKPCLGV